nr:MAG TPA: hypothetical protein [Caudoviricetes sp.]
MALVGRANKFLTVKEDLVQHYLDKGYTLYDDAGNILKEPVIKDMATMHEAYKRSQEKIKKLEKTIRDLIAENETLVAQLEEATNVDNPDETPAAKAPKKKSAGSKDDSTTE